MRTSLVVLLSCSLAGCFETDPNTSPPPRSSAGTLTLDWTIDGTKDPALCNRVSPSSVEVTVNGIDGEFAEGLQEPCDAFATSIELDEGSYVAHSRLFEASGFEVVTRAPIQAFTIRAHYDLEVLIDFPSRRPE